MGSAPVALKLFAISILLKIGARACSSNVLNFPSQVIKVLYATFVNAGEFRVPIRPEKPLLVGNPIGSENASAELWHDAQEVELSMLIALSKNKCFPRLIFACVIGLSA